MARKTLADRLAALAAKEASIHQQKARLKEIERRDRTRRLIAVGELIEKAGMMDWPPDVLLGALQEIAAKRPATDQQGAGSERAQPRGAAGAS